MEYATLFAVMGTAIAWLSYKNYRLSKQFNAVVMMIDMMIDGDIKVVKKKDGFDLLIKGE